jgi:hypothetical protein
MVAFHPFDSAENALENINAVTEHEMTDDLRVRFQIKLAFSIVSCFNFIFLWIILDRISSTLTFLKERNRARCLLEWCVLLQWSP